MLTFFRRIRKGLLDGNRTSKYFLYAIGEILLVMIGILLALQVNNWNENRMDRTKEKLLLKEINSEFQINKTELESTIRSYVRIRKHCVYIQNLFPIQQQEINRDSLIEVLKRIRVVPTADLSTGSISTLINTSSFDIISNPELRSLLIQWDDLISDYFERESQAINYTRQIIIPYLAERIPQPYHKGLDDERVDLTFMNSIKFENLINDRLRDANTLLNVVENEDDDIRKALDRIILLSSIHEN